MAGLTCRLPFSSVLRRRTCSATWYCRGDTPRTRRNVRTTCWGPRPASRARAPRSRRRSGCAAAGGWGRRGGNRSPSSPPRTRTSRRSGGRGRGRPATGGPARARNARRRWSRVEHSAPQRRLLSGFDHQSHPTGVRPRTTARPPTARRWRAPCRPPCAGTPRTAPGGAPCPSTETTGSPCGGCPPILGSDEELHRLVQLRVSGAADLVGEGLERPLALGHDAVPLLWHLRHALWGERQLAIHALRAAVALEDERPGEVLGRARFCMRLQVRLGPREGPEHLDGRGGFLLQRLQKLLFLAHGGSLPGRGRVAGVGRAAILAVCPTQYTGSSTSPRASSPGIRRRWSSRGTVPIGAASAATSPPRTSRGRSSNYAPSSTTGKSRSPTP